MTARYLGSLSIGDCIPGAAAVAAAGSAGISAVLPTLNEQLAGLLAYQPTTINFAASIAQLETMISALKASIVLGVTPPSLATQLAEIAAKVASLQADIGGIQAQLSIVTAFQSALGAAGVHAVAFDGLAGNFGADVGAVVATAPGVGPTDRAHGITLLTTVPATWALLATIFRVSV